MEKLQTLEKRGKREVGVAIIFRSLLVQGVGKAVKKSTRMSPQKLLTESLPSRPGVSLSTKGRAQKLPGKKVGGNVAQKSPAKEIVTQSQGFPCESGGGQ